MEAAPLFCSAENTVPGHGTPGTVAADRPGATVGRQQMWIQLRTLLIERQFVFDTAEFGPDARHHQ
jgi:hypothetical protein